MSHLWSGRFDGQPDPGVFAFGASFQFDRRLFEDDVEGSRAWVEALGGAGVLRPADVGAISAALVDILERGRRDPGFVSGPDEDVHSFVERQLVERIGEAGKRLHTGRSRNEQVALDLRLYLRRRIPSLQRAVVEVAHACVAQAERSGEATIPAYTHLRRAQPILIAHYWLSHVAALRRDHARLEFARDEADALPLGSGALAGTSYPIDTAALAARLGFTRVAANSLDAVADRDFVSSFLHAVALALVHASRLAEDLIIFATEEFGFIELDDRVSTGSSLMPQKKNPDPLELVRGKAGRVAGRLAGWLMTMKGLASGYNKDLQEDKEAVFDAEDTLAGCLAALTTVVDTLGMKVDRARAASGGFMLATDIADFLVARGMPFRAAHELVGAIVRDLIEHGREPESLSIDEWRAFSPLFDAGIRDAITARASVEARRTPQSTAPAAVSRALAEARAWVDVELSRR
jgi:argininosuccinate lyase